MIKLNVGCGSCRPTGWENLDSSLNALLQKTPVVGKIIPKLFHSVQYDHNNVRYMNVCKRWPYKDSSVSIVYASHLFEHLSIKDADFFLSESYRVLIPGGVIRIVVPDLYQITEKYLREYNECENPTEFIMWAINMHREGQYGSNINWLKKQVLEWQGYPHQHKFMYDAKSLAKKIRQFGFTDLRGCTYGESHYVKSISEVEPTKESYLSVYIEAVKPNT